MSRRTVFRVYLAIEGARLLGWVAFVRWLWASHDPHAWTSPEATLLAIVPVYCLGFPYGWIAMMFIGNWDLFRIGDQVPLSIAASHLLVWLAASGVLAFLLYRWSNRGSPVRSG